MKNKTYINFIPRIGSFWMGAHYSSQYKAVCIAVLPCLVVRIAKTPYKHDPGLFEKKGIKNG